MRESNFHQEDPYRQSMPLGNLHPQSKMRKDDNKATGLVRNFQFTFQDVSPGTHISEIRLQLKLINSKFHRSGIECIIAMHYW